jgi:pSer/pThr/pTyr-binding forkhead associated (FHA) protein
LRARLTELFAEAKRRRVFRTTGVYLVGVWAISQGLVELAPLFGASAILLRTLLIGALAFTPVVVILAWMFDIGRTGITRDRKDVERARADDDLSLMQTQVGAGSDPGAIAVGWSDRDGEQRILFFDEFYIGRASECRVRFYDPLVSRKHVRIFLLDGAWQLQDLGSRNGTTVDGQKVESMELGTGILGEVRVNEAGPPLTIEVIAPGDETAVGSSSWSSDPSFAHIRPEKIEAHQPARTGTMKS